MATGVYRRTEYYCTTCNGKHLSRSADREACEKLGHVIDARKSKVWTIQYVRDGKVYKESTKESTRGNGKIQREAEALLLERKGDIARGKPVTPRMNKVTFEDASANIVSDYVSNGKKSADGVQRRLRLHLAPAFGGWRMSNISTSDIRAYSVKRQKDGASNANVNRELAVLKRMFNLCIQDGTLAFKPHIPMLREDNVRQGFFEQAQYESVMKRLPPDVRPVIQFAYLTGWRVQSEVIPLEWRNVDFVGGEVRIDAGASKNREPRVFPMTRELRTLLEAQQVIHERMQKAGEIAPQVFAGDAQRFSTFKTAWKSACKAAGCPGRLLHDLRRTAVRNFVRKGIPERVAMTLTGHKTRSVFERYNIVSGGDLLDAARKLDAVPATPTKRKA